MNKITLRSVAFVVVIVGSAPVVQAQSLPPLMRHPAVRTGERPPEPGVVQLQAEKAFRWYLPLVPACKDGQQTYCVTQTDRGDFYGEYGVSAMPQVKFLANTKRKALAADLISDIAGPFRLAFGAVVSDVAAVDPGRAGEEQRNALDRLSSGGDFYLNLGFPVFAVRRRGFQFYTSALPRFGLLIPALGVNDVVEVTEWNVDVGAEVFAQAGSEKFAGFVHVRPSYQWISNDFANQIMLGDKSRFAMTQYAVGVQLVQAIRLSVEGLWGAPDTFKNNLKPRLLVQLIPAAF